MDSKHVVGQYCWSSKSVAPVLVSPAVDPVAPEPDALHPRVGVLVSIVPSAYERSFWNSATWREAARGIDMFFFVLAFLNNYLLVRFQSKLPPSALPYFQELACMYVVLALVQTAWGSFPNNWYHWARPYLVVINRVIRFFHLAANLYAITQCFVEGSCVGMPKIITKLWGAGASNITQYFVSTRCLLVATQSITVILHTIYLRFAFKTQFLVQCLYVGVLVSFNSVIAAHLLNAPPHAMHMESACKAMDATSSAAFVLLVGWVPDQHDYCSRYSSWMMVLFCISFWGFTFPLYFAYRIERGLKRRYIHREVLHQQEPFTTWQCTILGVCGDCLWLLMYATMCWQLVVRYHQHVVRVAMPVEWNGVDSNWYWKLLLQ